VECLNYGREMDWCFQFTQLGKLGQSVDCSRFLLKVSSQTTLTSLSAKHIMLESWQVFGVNLKFTAIHAEVPNLLD
jgi:hypothetical protein